MLRKLIIVVPAAIVIAAPAQALATPVSSPSVAPVATAPATQGIIMSDGRICNPRWGC